MVHRPVVTKFWVNGRASENRDEWTEEVRADCEKCYDDKLETSEVQAERIGCQRSRGDSLAALGHTDTDHNRQGSPRTRENDEEQGQRAR